MFDLNTLFPIKGFGHIGFICDDVYKACDAIRKLGYGFKKVGTMLHIEFIQT